MTRPLLELEGVTRWYPFGTRMSGGRRYVQAVTDVSFSVAEGETVGLIGESGCGKSTLGRAVIGLDPLRAGEIRLEGERISGLGDRRLRPHRRNLQMVWQNAAGAVNQRKRVDRIIREPLDIHRIGTAASRNKRVAELLDLVAFRPELAHRYPHEVSGGQLQRVVIARALALEPKLLICDEPTASLDVSVRAQIINLLADLRDRLALTMLYISHDLSTVSVVSDRILIMYLGRVVEECSGSAIDRGELLHPYSQALVASVPTPDPEIRRTEPPVVGEVPSAVDLPTGCPYHPRCPLAKAVCADIRPELSAVGGSRVACHAVAGDHHMRWKSEREMQKVVESNAPVASRIAG